MAAGGSKALRDILDALNPEGQGIEVASDEKTVTGSDFTLVSGEAGKSIKVLHISLSLEAN